MVGPVFRGLHLFLHITFLVFHMKIMLVNPGVGLMNEQPPMGLMVLAAVGQKNGHMVKIVNRLCGDNLEQAVDDFKPDVAGVTGTTQAINDAYECATFLRGKGVFTVIGGIHATVLPEEALQFSDAVVTGEGEQTLFEVFDSHQKGIVKGEPVQDLDSLPFPAYDLIDMNHYMAQGSGILGFGGSASKTIGILTSRGCPYHCTFCYNSFRDVPIRYRSAAKVVDEVRYLKQRFGVNTVCFNDDNFFMNRRRVLEICDLIREERVLWAANARVNGVQQDVLEATRDSGCVQVAFGLESASQRMLDLYCKGATVEQAVEAVALCDRVGLMVSGSFIFGGPTETMVEMMMSRDFMIRNNVDGGIGVCVMTPFPGTKIWDWCVERGLVKPSLELWRKFYYQSVSVEMSCVSIPELVTFINRAIQLGSDLHVSRLPSRMKKLEYIVDKIGWQS